MNGDTERYLPSTTELNPITPYGDGEGISASELLYNTSLNTMRRSLTGAYCVYVQMISCFLIDRYRLSVFGNEAFLFIYSAVQVFLQSFFRLYNERRIFDHIQGNVCHDLCSQVHTFM